MKLKFSIHGDGLTDSIDLGYMTTTTNTDADIYTSEFFLEIKKNYINIRIL